MSPGPVAAPPEPSDINWRTLRAYARAVRDFTRTKAPVLLPAAFTRVRAADVDGRPDAEFLDVPGGRLGYRHYAASRSQRCLVIVHGSGCFGDLHQAMARRIADADLAQIYTLDMRGHGLSSGPRGHATDYPSQMVDDIARFVRHLRDIMPGCRVMLAGHSAGGGLVLAFARSPDEHLVASYVFIAPYLGLGSTLNRPHFGGWVRLRGLTMKLLTVANLFGIRRFNGMTAVEFNTAAAGDTRYVAGWSFTTLLAFGPGRWIADAAPLPARKPVLVLACEQDECFVQPGFAEAFATVAPHAEVPHVGPGGHWDVLVEDRAIALLGDWIARQREPRLRTLPRQAARVTRAA